ncbi:MAG: PIN domain nuclease, partial [Cyanobacteria bacterium J06632_19]
MKTQLDNALVTHNSGLVLVDLTADVVELAIMPPNIVPNMSSRIIVATAKYLGLPLITKDNQISSSGIITIW